MWDRFRRPDGTGATCFLRSFRSSRSLFSLLWRYAGGALLAIQLVAPAELRAQSEPEPRAPGAAEGQSPDGAERDSESAGGDGDEDADSIDAQLDAIEREVAGGETGDDGEGDESDDGEDDASSSAEGTSTSGASSATALNPELSVVLSGGIAETVGEPLLLGGPDPKRFGFFLQGVELAIQADVDPFFTFESHLIATPAGMKVGEAYGTTLALPASLQARFGKFKTDFGRVNPVHAHAWHFTALPIVNAKMLGPAGLNGLGVEIGQILPLPWYVEWSLAVQDLSAPVAGRSFLRSPGRLESPLDLTASARLKQFWELGPDWSLLVGLNGAVGRNDAGRPGSQIPGHAEIYGVDTHLRWKSSRRQEVAWQTEAMWRRRVSSEGRLNDVGAYSYLYWMPSPRWEFGGRWEFASGPLESRRDYLDPDWRELRQRGGLSTAFRPSEFSRLRLEYMADGFRRGLDDLGHTVLLNVQLVTGAHGAHDF